MLKKTFNFLTRRVTDWKFFNTNFEEIPLLTPTDYHNHGTSLNGWFYVKSICIPYKKVPPLYNQYICLKNGELNNPKGFSTLEQVDDGYIANRYVDNELHSENGGASVKTDRPLIWTGSDFEIDPKSETLLCLFFNKGKTHSLDGPAIISKNEIKYCIHGQELSYEEFVKHPEVIKFHNKLAVLEVIRNA